MALRNILLAGMASSASAVKILTSAFGTGPPNGTITTFELTPGVGAGSLKVLNAFDGAGPQPTWMDTSLGGGKVVVIDEAWATPLNATLSMITQSGNDSFKLGQQLSIIGSPVAVQFYNNDSAMAIAHYGTGAISTFTYKGGAFAPLEQFKYSNETHGPKPQQADGSHVHHTVLDPTGKYLVFPDLGLDAVHVYCIDSKTSKIGAHNDIKFPAGYGPRHAAFWKSGSDTYLFIIHELESRMTSHKVTYGANGNGISFAPVDDVSTFGPNPGNTTGSGAAEIYVSPDNAFVVGSNRNLPKFTIDNPDTTNSTKIPSDSLVTFKPSADGKLAFVQLAPSGGISPRHFSFNKDGSMVGVANGGSFKPSFDVYERDIKTGMMGDKIASSIEVGGGVNNVRWL